MFRPPLSREAFKNVQFSENETEARKLVAGDFITCTDSSDSTNGKNLFLVVSTNNPDDVGINFPHLYPGSIGLVPEIGSFQCVEYSKLASDGEIKWEKIDKEEGASIFLVTLLKMAAYPDTGSVSGLLFPDKIQDICKNWERWKSGAKNFIDGYLAEMFDEPKLNELIVKALRKALFTRSDGYMVT